MSPESVIQRMKLCEESQVREAVRNSLACNLAPLFVDIPSGSTSMSKVVNEELVSSAITFKKLYNFRDICREGSKVQPGRIFRGANLCYASQEDGDYIVNKLKIKTLIDLRRGKERGLSADDGQILGPLNPYFLGKSREHRKYFHIPLTATTSFSLAILGSTEVCAFGRALWKGVTRWDMSELEREITKSAFRDRSLDQVYTLFLLNTQEQIFKVMMILLDPSNYPVAFFCSGGKDRTALITMLVQGCCGESPEVVIASYHESGHNLEVVADRLRQENIRDGLDPVVFGQTPKEAMEKLLEFINSEWGGIPEYLTSLGFGPEKQARLREILSSNKNVQSAPK